MKTESGRSREIEAREGEMKRRKGEKESWTVNCS
jgi:hypothetical protein